MSEVQEIWSQSLALRKEGEDCSWEVTSCGGVDVDLEVCPGGPRLNLSVEEARELAAAILTVAQWVEAAIPGPPGSRAVGDEDE